MKFIKAAFLLNIFIISCTGTWVEMPYSSGVKCTEKELDKMKLVNPYQYWQDVCDGEKKKYTGKARCKSEGKGIEVNCE